jgi:hypothetical protein
MHTANFNAAAAIGFPHPAGNTIAAIKIWNDGYGFANFKTPSTIYRHQFTRQLMT